MKPVEIEILMKDRLSNGIDKSREGLNQLQDASRSVTKVLGQMGEEGARASDKYNGKLSDLRQGVEKMSASLKAMGVSEKDAAGVLMRSSEQNVQFVEAQVTRLRAMEDTLRSALENGNTALAESTKQEMETVETWINEALDSIQKNAERIPAIVKKSASTAPAEHTENMKTLLRTLTSEIARATLEYRNMTDAERNSAAGMELKRKLEEMIKKAAELRDAMDDVNRQVRGEASDTRTFDALTQGLNVVTSTAGAATSALQMFGASQEDLVAIQTKLQATLAISNALTVIQNNLQRESALMSGIRSIKESALATSIAIKTAAEGKGVIVTKLATVAQAAFNVVAKANPYVLLGMAILTVVGALVAFTRGSKEATEAEKRQLEETKRLRKQQEEMTNALGRAAGNVEAKYRSLQQQWNRLKTDSEKNKWIKANADKFHELGLKVSSVKDAEQVLVDMAPQVITALKAVAEAEAYSDLYKDSIKTRAEKWEHRIKSRATGDYYVRASEGSSISEKEKEYLKGLGFRDNKHGGDVDYSDPLIGDGAVKSRRAIDAINEYRKKKATETKQTLESKYNEEVNFYADKWKEAEQKAADARSHIPDKLRYEGKEDKNKENKAKEQQEYNDLLKKQTEERIRKDKDAELQAEQYRINAMRESSDKVIRQIELDRKKELDAIEAAKQAAVDAHEKEARAIWEAQNPKATEKGQTWNNTGKVGKSFVLTEDEETMFREREKAAQASYDRQIAELYQRDTQYMLDYLKEYGTMQERRYAIAKEYDEKIAKLKASGANEWEIKATQKEKERELASTKAEELANGIDWSQLMGGVGSIVKSIAKETLTRIDDYMKTDEYKKLSATDKKSISELRSKVSDNINNDSVNPFSNQIWKDIEIQTKEYEDSIKRLNDANAAHQQAIKEVEEAEKEYSQSLLTGDIAKANLAAIKKQRAEERKDSTSDDVTSAQTKTSEAQRKLTGTTEQLNEGLNDVVSNFQSLTSGSLFGFAKGISGLINQLTGAGKEAQGAGNVIGGLGSKAGGLIGAILQLIDILGTEPAKFIDDLLAKIADVVQAILSQLPEIIIGVIKGAANIVGSVFQGLGGMIGLDLSSGNEEEVAKAIDRLTKRNELLEQAIDDLTDEMKMARGASAIETSQRAKELQEEINANYRNIAKEQAGYHSAHHSFNYYWDGYSDEQIARLSKQIGREWNGDLWSLSPEEMKMLRSNVDMWKQIQDTGKGNYGGRVAEKLNDYIEQAGKLEEITDALYENLTTTTKDNVFDDFLNSLYDLADGSEEVMDDIADNWQKMVNRMAVNNLVGAKFEKELEGWYENLAKLNESRTNGEITDEEYRKRLDALKAEYEGYVENAKKDIETLRTEGIIKETEENKGTTQSGKAGAFTTMSQDQAGKLEGLFVSGQIHWASLDDKMTDVSVQIGAAGDTLKKIEEHTGSSALSLEEIKNDLKILKRDGIKVK